MTHLIKIYFSLVLAGSLYSFEVLEFNDAVADVLLKNQHDFRSDVNEGFLSFYNRHDDAFMGKIKIPDGCTVKPSKGSTYWARGGLICTVYYTGENGHETFSPVLWSPYSLPLSTPMETSFFNEDGSFLTVKIELPTAPRYSPISFSSLEILGINGESYVPDTVIQRRLSDRTFQISVWVNVKSYPCTLSIFKQKFLRIDPPKENKGD